MELNTRIQTKPSLVKLKSFIVSILGFPDGSDSKESTCNAEDSSLIPGTGRSLGEGIGYSLPFSWASLVAQIIKEPPAMRETWIPSLGWEDSLEEGMATLFCILAWKIPWTEGPDVLQSLESQRVRHN